MQTIVEQRDVAVSEPIKPFVELDMESVERVSGMGWITDMLGLIHVHFLVQHHLDHDRHQRPR